MLYFGYTSCPDVCPLGGQLVRALRSLILQSERGCSPFVGVDPERDSRGVASYLGLFYRSVPFEGGGTCKHAPRCAQQFRLYYEQVDDHATDAL